ncbi:MAG: acetylglutamate kinase [Clostridia bacterium]
MKDFNNIDNISNSMKAGIIAKALPYIQQYYNKIIVIKYGGNAMINEQLKKEVMQDITLLSLVGIKVVLVHGGGPEINKTLEKMNIQSKFIDGLRYTDKETAEVVQMVLAGKTNKDLVSLLGSFGAKSIGLCGIDNKMLIAQKAQKEVDLGFVGEIKSVDTTAITDAISMGYIPVIATVSQGEDGEIYNVNADTAAASIAAALGAENLILMTDTVGLLADVKDESSLIPVVNVSDVPVLIKQGTITGGMIPKIACCVDAVRRGVPKALIIDGRISHSILVEIFTDEGIGTMFI